MTPQELIDVETIKSDLDILDIIVAEFTNISVNARVAGKPVDINLFSTQIDDFKAALIVEATALRDAKQVEFDDFVGTDV